MFEFHLFKKPAPAGQTVSLKIKDMHCASCALSIDEALEEQAGVKKSATHYARSETKVTFDKKIISLEQIEKLIEGLGYSVDK